MAEYVLSHADRLADKPALAVTGLAGMVLSYAALKARVRAVAGGLLETGLTPGDRVLFRLGNSPDFPIAYLACIWAGLVPVPTSAQLTTHEVTLIATEVAPALILAASGLALPEGQSCPVLTDLPTGKPREPALGNPNRLAYIIFTSGTSGSPRGVCHAHRAIWARRMMHEGWYGLSEVDRVMHAGAFNWTYTLGTGLMDPWSLGATAVIPGEGTTADMLATLIKDHGTTIFAAAPGVFRKMLKTDLPKMPHLRHGLSAGEHLGEPLRQAWRAATGTGLHQALGMSEVSTFISSSPACPAPPGSSGRPQPGRRITILDKGAPVPFDTPGILAIGTGDPGLMLGYLGETGIDGDWFETGDMAQMAADGTITYLGRADDVMTAGGYRVSPMEVEACFADLPELTSCAAVQVEVKQGATVIALCHTGTAQEAKLKAHAQKLLARYKQPRLYIPLPELPYGPNGKLNRRALRAQCEALHVRDDPA